MSRMMSRARERYRERTDNVLGGGFTKILSVDHVPGSDTVNVFIYLSYVDSNKPVTVEVKSETYHKSDTTVNDLIIDVFLDKTYDVTVNGEPTFPELMSLDPSDFVDTHEGIPIASFDIKNKGSYTVYQYNLYDLPTLYLLEHRYKVLSMIIDKLEHVKQEVVDENERRDLESVSSFLKWLRDKIFPILDLAVDISHIKNEDQLYESIDVGYTILILHDFIIGGYLFYI